MEKIEGVWNVKKWIFIIGIGIFFISFAVYGILDIVLHEKPQKTSMKVSIYKLNEEEKHAGEAEDIHQSHVNDPHVQEMVSKYENPVNAINYLFAAAQSGNKDAFIDAFEAMEINEALFQSKDPDKEAVAEDMMKRLTRNYTLESVNFIKEKFVFEKEATRCIVELVYKNQKKVRLSIILKLRGTAHTEGELIYFVKTSPWDLIRQIEEE